MNPYKITSVLFLSFFLFFAYELQAQYEEKMEPGKLNFTVANSYQIVNVNPVKGKKVKNVILMIGDGMGLTQISMAWVANHGKLNLDNFKQTGLSRTYAANKLITDSGAAGTAMATGQKSNYHAVGVDVNGKSLPSITDLAHAKGLSTAVVVTCGLTDATPATFCASNADRDQLEEIAADFLTCNVDFLFGGGRKEFTQRTDGRNLMYEMQQKGYHSAKTWEETKSISSGKVFAVIEDGQLPMANERGDIWRQASMQAISNLSKNNKARRITN